MHHDEASSQRCGRHSVPARQSRKSDGSFDSQENLHQQMECEMNLSRSFRTGLQALAFAGVLGCVVVSANGAFARSAGGHAGGGGGGGAATSASSGTSSGHTSIGLQGSPTSGQSKGSASGF